MPPLQKLKLWKYFRVLLVVPVSAMPMPGVLTTLLDTAVNVSLPHMEMEGAVWNQVNIM